MIETERLIFREYRDEDFNDLFEIIGDKETMAHYDRPYDEKGCHRWIEWSKENYEKYGFGLWVLMLKETGEFIGDCGITMQNIDGEILPEIGWHINKKHWRKGYGKEAATAVRDWGFKNTEFKTLYSYMTSTNVASYRLAEAIGMKKIKEFNTESGIDYVYAVTKE